MPFSLANAGLNAIPVIDAPRPRELTVASLTSSSKPSSSYVVCASTTDRWPSVSLSSIGPTDDRMRAWYVDVLCGEVWADPRRLSSARGSMGAYMHGTGSTTSCAGLCLGWVGSMSSTCLASETMVCDGRG